MSTDQLDTQGSAAAAARAAEQEQELLQKLLAAEDQAREMGWIAVVQEIEAIRRRYL